MPVGQLRRVLNVFLFFSKMVMLAVLTTTRENILQNTNGFYGEMTKLSLDTLFVCSSVDLSKRSPSKHSESFQVWNSTIGTYQSQQV